jgi:hypothetical protein
MVSSNDGMAEILNKFFASVFCKEGPEPVPEAEVMDCRSKLDNSRITETKVKEKIKKLRPKSAAGPDHIGPSLLQQLLEVAVPAQKIIFSHSLEEGEVPVDWRTANVTPIFKKGVKADPGNYRPVSLTSVCCKVLESVIRDDLMEHLLRNNLMRESQHGFMARKSCTTNLLEFLRHSRTRWTRGTPWTSSSLTSPRLLTRCCTGGYSHSWRHTESRARYYGGLAHGCQEESKEWS